MFGTPKSIAFNTVRKEREREKEMEDERKRRTQRRKEMKRESGGGGSTSISIRTLKTDPHSGIEFIIVRGEDVFSFTQEVRGRSEHSIQQSSAKWCHSLQDYFTEYDRQEYRTVTLLQFFTQGHITLSRFPQIVSSEIQTENKTKMPL